MQKTKGKKANEGKKAIKIIIIAFVLVALLVAFYYYVSNKMNGGDSGEVDQITKSQQVLLRNMDTNYPPSPKEVVKYYSEITQCFYNEEHTEEEVEALAMQIRKLYDDELVANQTEEDYLMNLKTEIISMRENDCVISSYSTSSSTDVEYYSEDGYEWAKLYSTYGIRKGTSMVNTNEQFLLRKDTLGHWKIYGWTLVEDK